MFAILGFYPRKISVTKIFSHPIVKDYHLCYYLLVMLDLFIFLLDLLISILSALYMQVQLFDSFAGRSVFFSQSNIH